MKTEADAKNGGGRSLRDGVRAGCKDCRSHCFTPQIGERRSEAGSTDLQDWWTTSILQGPIIEQMTHFVDLIRFIGGEVDMTTISFVSSRPRLHR